MEKQSLKTAVITLAALFSFLGTSQGDIEERIVAVVNNEVITLTELNRALRPYMDKIETAGYADAKKEKMIYKLKQDMLSRMIDRKLTDQEVERLGITVSDKEVDAAIERLKQSQFMTQEDLEKALKQDGMSFREYRKKIHREILRPKLINYSVKSKVVVTDSDVEAYYRENRQDYTGVKRYHLYNILIPVESPGMDDSRAEPLKTATRIKELLDQGKSFQELARRYSAAPNASDGGELGVMDAETLSAKLEKVVSKLAEGDHSRPVLTDQGYQLFYVKAVQPAEVKELDQVRDQIFKKLYDEIVEKKFQSWLQSLRENSHIKKML
ncbi:MAG: SurA N-terminal domain-containing protein [Desulfobacteraceae bacterium]